MDAENKLRAWDYANSFSMKDVACLILGIDPSEEEHKTPSAGLHAVYARLQNDSEIARVICHEVLLGEREPLQKYNSFQEGLYPFWLSRLKAQPPAGQEDGFGFTQLDLDTGTEYFWCTFAREEIARWLRDNQLSSVYLFDKIQNDPPAYTDYATEEALIKKFSGKGVSWDTAFSVYSHITSMLLSQNAREADPAQQPAEPDKELGTRERNSLLRTIAGLVSLMLDTTDDGGQASVYKTQNEIIATLVDRFPTQDGISKATLENKIAAGKNLLNN